MKKLLLNFFLWKLLLVNKCFLGQKSRLVWSNEKFVKIKCGKNVWNLFGEFFFNEFFFGEQVWSGLVWSGPGKVLLDRQVRGDLENLCVQPNKQPTNNQANIEPIQISCWTGKNLEIWRSAIQLEEKEPCSRTCGLASGFPSNWIVYRLILTCFQSCQCTF